MDIVCEGARHQLRWSGDGLQLLDHPDLDGELALVAFGGAEPTCVSYYHLWNEAVADGGFLAEWVDVTRLSDTWLSWLAMALERMRTEGFHEFLRRLPPARAQRMGQFLHRFPVPWIDRAAGAISQSVADGEPVICVHAPGLVADAVSPRLRRAFVDSVGGRQLAVGAAALVPLTITVEQPGSGAAPSGEPVPLIDGVLSGTERGISISVDRSWLHRVWAAGAAVIEGRLVLDLIPGELPDGSTATAPVASMVSWQANQDEGSAIGSGPRAAGLRPRLQRRAVRFVDHRWQLVP